jgi:hypothetical protein
MRTTRFGGSFFLRRTLRFVKQKSKISLLLFANHQGKPHQLIHPERLLCRVMLE